MHQLLLAIAGSCVGFLVGLTGVGGGAVMTPVLVLLFGVDPTVAVSSDLVASLVMKPVGSAVHAKRGTVNTRLVAWLALGSIPSAFFGAYLLSVLSERFDVEVFTKYALGVALLLAVAGIVGRASVQRSRDEQAHDRSVVVRRAATVAVGVIGGTVVGLTSVGSGSLMIVAMMLLYPRLETRSLVGTDLAQAIPLVGAAAVGHLIFGDVHFSLAGWLLVGALPGVYLGARISSRHASPFVRPVLLTVLVLSALRLLGAPTAALGVLIAAAVAAGGLIALRSVRTAPVPSLEVP